jgi:predicted nuclease of predicted toxin-antitoxin system
MSERFYFDHHVEDAIVEGLRARGVDCLLTREEGRERARDEELLQRATDLGRIMVSSDEDMLVITARRLADGKHFAGLVHLKQLAMPVCEAIAQLELIAKASLPDEYLDRVLYMPM